ncbi:MAG: ribosome silencing factor [Burkholderiaceae bacterium]
MDLRKLQRVIVDALDDIKAQDIKVFNTTGQTELFDRVVVATATSNRQTRALASHVRDKVKEAGGTVVSVEGGDTGEWVLVDVGDVVVHIMQPAIRSYYNLEELWGGKPVRVQVGRPASGASRASPSIDDEDDGAISGEIVPRAAAPARRSRTRAQPAGGAGDAPAGAVKKGASKTAPRTARKAAPKAGAKAAPKTGSKAAPRKAAARKPRSSA